MKIIKNSRVKEEIYSEVLSNGLTVMIVPRKNTEKKYVIWATKYGSIDNTFIIEGDTKITNVPDGIAHFLEHKLFEQKNETNSLDTLSMLGVNANAYTTNDHTAYLFECNDNFYAALDEFMDYVQNPYFTDENVEKEKGIIAQEIKMYEDNPGSKLYKNALECLYFNNPVRVDIAGTVESIEKIDKDILDKCYGSFYQASNMVLVLAGDFEAKEILEEVKSRMKFKKANNSLGRIYPKEPLEINKKSKIKKMDINNPIFIIAFKDIVEKDKKELIKKAIAIEVVMNVLIGKSSTLFKKIYDEGLTSSEFGLYYEYSTEYAHLLIEGQSRDPKKIQKLLNIEIDNIIKQGINEEDFKRIKKMMYGNSIKEYENISYIARLCVENFIDGTDIFEYFVKYNFVTKEYCENILKENFIVEKQIISIVESKNNE